MANGSSGESEARKASKILKQQRLIEVEDRLVAGINPARIEHELSAPIADGGWGIGPRQIRKYITEVYRKWEAESEHDAPHRREKLIRMAERLFAKASAGGKYGAANGALTTLAKLGGAFARGPERQDVLERLGPPPTDDPTKALIYAQNVLVLSLQDIAADPTMDPERRYRLLADLSAKVGMTHAKALVQHKLETVTKRLGVAKDKSGRLESTRGVVLPAAARRGGRVLGQPPVRGPDADPAAPEDARDSSGGGGPVGPAGPKVH